MSRRSLDGTLIVKRCLNEADPDEVFGDVCDERGEGREWITLFREYKKDNEEFQPINDDTIVVFCKLYEPDFDDVTYLGHLLMERRSPCSELLISIIRMAELSNETDYNLYVEVPPFGIRDVTGSKSSLAQVPRMHIVSTD